MTRLAVAAVVAWAVAAGSAGAANWQQASSPHFLIYSQDSAAALRAFGERLERYDAAMRWVRQLPDEPLSPANRLTVYVVSTDRQVQSLLTMGRGKSPDVAGFYEPRAGHSFAIVPRNEGDGSKYRLSPQIVLLHEYAHHFMFHNYPGAFPAWFSEGFAEFNSTAKFGADGSVGLGLPARIALMTYSITPYRLPTYSPRPVVRLRQNRWTRFTPRVGYWYTILPSNPQGRVN